MEQAAQASGHGPECQSSKSAGTALSTQGLILGGTVWSRLGLIQLGIFCNSMTPNGMRSVPAWVRRQMAEAGPLSCKRSSVSSRLRSQRSRGILRVPDARRAERAHRREAARSPPSAAAGRAPAEGAERGLRRPRLRPASSGAGTAAAGPGLGLRGTQVTVAACPAARLPPERGGAAPRPRGGGKRGAAVTSSGGTGRGRAWAARPPPGRRPRAAVSDGA